MSIDAMKWAKSQKTGSASRKAVLVAIADYADENGIAWPSQRRLAEDVELTERSVRTAIAELVEAGFIARITRRAADGTRKTDKLALQMGRDNRKELPPEDNRKDFPAEEQPENDDQTTGNLRQNHRKMAAKPPEAVSGKLPVELPLGNHQRNVSDASASGLPATLVHRDLSPIDRLWVYGKPMLVECGLTFRQSGNMIGRWIAQYRDHVRIFAAIEFARAAGTREPIALVVGCLEGRERGFAQPSAKGRRSGMVSLAINEFGTLQ